MDVTSLIRKWGDPVLKVVCDPVAPGESLPFVDTMIRVCRKAPGVGLGAPQIGETKRVIVTLVGFPAVYINPVVEWMSDESDVETEGCLSCPGIHKPIRRAKSIRLAYLNGRREPQARIFDGYLARVIQHEVDHLDGICRVGDDAYAADGPTPDVKPEPLMNRRTLMAAALFAAFPA